MRGRVGVVVTGVAGLAFLDLLVDLLRDHDVDLEVVDESARPGSIDLLVAVVNRTNAATMIASARRREPQAAVLAVVPIGDPELEELARRSGARATARLDGSLTTLRATVLRLLADPQRNDLRFRIGG